MVTINVASLGLKIEQTEAVVKRAMYLAHVACGSAFGMGVFQERKEVTEAEVWDNVCTDGDYNFGGPSNEHKVAGVPMEMDVKVYGDYVFGRMMKTGMTYNRSTGDVKLRDDDPRPSYQIWARKYQTYKALLNAAAKDLQDGDDNDTTRTDG